jgi:microcystin-dependent protein
MRFPPAELNIENLLEIIYPVGSLYLSVLATNPNDLFGFGTWEAIGAGRMLVGQDSGDADFDTLEETGGAKTVTLTEAQLPAHTHAVTDPGHTHVQGVNSATTGGTSGYTPDTSTNTRVNSGYSTSSATTGITNQNTGGGQAHSNLPPFIVVKMWKRTA